MKFDRTFVLSPLDNLAVLLRADVSQKWRMGGHVFVIFQGTEMVAAFRAKRRKTSLSIVKFEGDPAARKVLEEFEQENELEVGEHVDRISDAEVMEWYTKMYGRTASK